MANRDRNPFGGKNPNSLYVPMTEIEQEFLSRLRDSGDLVLQIHGWGYILQPRFTIGDHQVVFPIDMVFDRPEVPIPVTHFDLELRAQSGLSFFREKQTVEYGGQPLWIGSGTQLSMMWHIGIRAIDPNVIRAYMPGTHGLTSRRLDRDTGALTLTGNMKLDGAQKRLIRYLTLGENSVQADRDKKIKT